MLSSSQVSFYDTFYNLIFEGKIDCDKDVQKNTIVCNINYTIEENSLDVMKLSKKIKYIDFNGALFRISLLFCENTLHKDTKTKVIYNIKLKFKDLYWITESSKSFVRDKKLAILINK